MKSVVIGKLVINGNIKYRVLTIKSDFSGLILRDISENNIMEELEKIGISEDYEISDNGLKVKDARNLHTIRDMGLERDTKNHLEYIIVSIDKPNKTAIAFDILEGKLVKGSIDIMPMDKTLSIKMRILPRQGETCKKLKYGLKSIHCDNIWIDEHGNFIDNHYIEIKHNNCGEDIPKTTAKSIKEKHLNYNKQLGIVNNKNAQSIEKPDNILDIKHIDNSDYTDRSKDDNTNSTTDAELDQYYDSNGNCIDFDGLSAYLDKKRLEDLDNKDKDINKKIEKPSIEVGISEAFKGILDETEKRWVYINKNDLYEEMVFSLAERGILDIPSTLLDTIKYKIIRTLDGTSLEFREIGTDQNGVIQYEEIEVTPQYVYLVEFYKDNWKKYYLLQANSLYRNRLKVQCISDWVEKKDELDFSIFIKKYTQWIGRKEYLRTSDWS